MTAALPELVDYFAAELLESTGAAHATPAPDAAGEQRRMLAALLTIRRPRPIPAHILEGVEALLAHERENRQLILAADLPTLVDDGVELPGFPADRVGFWRGDLTTLQADAIVNAANSQMLGCFTPGHACIDNAIHAAAGPRLRLECHEHMRAQGHLEPTGTAVVTGGYQLPASYVIHTVGPIVTGALNEGHRAALASSYRSILSAAEQHPAIASVGLCSVSTGVFGFPKAPAAQICLEAITEHFGSHPDSTLRVIVSLFADVDEAAYRGALEGVVAR
ncbi:macro domain-containing protein [Microbacterium sp. Marseille-Q6965]|uniref:macro domain-containing protein n=1 Tax=Microbacterium sp. Marseille-Q6965 TaxID=2965072 RepID=UPI0021B74DEF|nr:macro domain-containing protein [Microbacterium sp. Marseille-Q6965]